VMYQNLVRSVDPEASVSVHLCRFPEPDAALADDTLVADVALVQRIVNLGRAARSKAAIKVRQPIGELMVKVAKPEEAAVVERLAPQILEELNVKSVKLVADLGELVSHSVRPKTPILGPKYGRELPTIVAALRSLPAADVASRVAKGESIELAAHQILADEIEVMTSDRAGYATAVDGDFAVAVSTALTPALVDEGVARELVHRIQGMRKSAGFRIEDYISTRYEGDPDLARVFEQFAAYVQQETLSRGLTQDATGAAEYSEVLKVEGREILVGVSRIA
jgi:isoleucyl-tRNA synthetase